MRVDGDRMELSFHLVQRCVLFESCVMRTLFLMKPNTISHGQMSSGEYIMQWQTMVIAHTPSDTRVELDRHERVTCAHLALCLTRRAHCLARQGISE